MLSNNKDTILNKKLIIILVKKKKIWGQKKHRKNSYRHFKLCIVFKIVGILFL